MADYICRTRSNYFQVTDEQALHQLIHRCLADGKVCIKSKKEEGKLKHCIFCDGHIEGISCQEAEEGDCEAFIRELKALLPAGEAIIITEAGWEKYNYVTSHSYVITRKGNMRVSIEYAVLVAARKLLNDQHFNTQMDY